MAAPYDDDFNRADNTTLASSGWTVVTGAPIVAANQLRHIVVDTATTTTARRTATLPADDMAAQIAWVPTVGGSDTIKLRAAVRMPSTGTAGDGYFFEHARTNGVASARIYKVVAGVATNLVTTGVAVPAPTAAQVIRCEAQGTTIRGYVAGTLIRTTTDASLSGSTQRCVGVGIERTLSINVADNFAAESLAVVVAAGLRPLIFRGTETPLRGNIRRRRYF